MLKKYKRKGIILLRLIKNVFEWLIDKSLSGDRDITTHSETTYLENFVEIFQEFFSLIDLSVVNFQWGKKLTFPKVRSETFK